MLSLILIVLAQWNNSPQVHISLHFDSLSWLRANSLGSYPLMVHV